MSIAALAAAGLVGASIAGGLAKIFTKENWRDRRRKQTRSWGWKQDEVEFDILQQYTDNKNNPDFQKSVRQRVDGILNQALVPNLYERATRMKSLDPADKAGRALLNDYGLDVKALDELTRSVLNKQHVTDAIAAYIKSKQPKTLDDDNNQDSNNSQALDSNAISRSGIIPVPETQDTIYAAKFGRSMRPIDTQLTNNEPIRVTRPFNTTQTNTPASTVKLA